MDKIIYHHEPYSCTRCGWGRSKLQIFQDEDDRYYVECSVCHKKGLKGDTRYLAIFNWNNTDDRVVSGNGSRPKKTHTYMVLDKDYDHVLYTADTIEELSKLSGVKRKSIDEMMSRARRTGQRCKYIRVENTWEDDDE